MSNSLRGTILNPDVIRGKSAYEIAVMHGFEGTEEQWLDSLKSTPFTTDKTLTLKDGVLSVNTATTEDRNLPIKAADVDVIVGDIEVLLETI